MPDMSAIITSARSSRFDSAVGPPDGNGWAVGGARITRCARM